MCVSFCPHCQRGLSVELQQGWVDDLGELFRSAKVVLYDSADHWRRAGVSEGFGLPPIEALACGCVVFSSFNHALADTLDPGHVAWQIGRGTLSSDLDRITAAAQLPSGGCQNQNAAAFVGQPQRIGCP